MNLSASQPKLTQREDLQDVVADVTAAAAFHFMITGFEIEILFARLQFVPLMYDQVTFKSLNYASHFLRNNYPAIFDKSNSLYIC